MITLPDLLNFVITTLQTSALCRSVRVLETHQFAEWQFALKVRAELLSGDRLQVRLYCNRAHTDYAYQLTRGEKTLARWDNKEHFPNVSSFPHHLHLATGRVSESPLTGDPLHDLLVVLNTLPSLLN